MTEVSVDELGPVDYLMVEFRAGASSFTGEMAAELRALVDSGTIRVIDVLILIKDADGIVDATELSDVGELGELRAVEGELAGNSWPRRTSTTSLPRWSREALPGCSSGRTCGPRPSHQRCGVLAGTDRQRAVRPRWRT